MEIQITIPVELYTIEVAAKKLGTDHTRKAFYRNHVNKPDGLRLTRINGKDRVSSLELARYISEHTTRIEA